MSAGQRGFGVMSCTAPTVAMRLRFALSASASRACAVAVRAAFAVGSRSASGRITIPLPSAESTNTSAGSTPSYALVRPRRVKPCEVNRGRHCELFNLAFADPLPTGPPDRIDRLGKGPAR